MTPEKQVCEYLDNLKATSSTNSKVELLQDYLKVDAFRRLVTMALTSTYSYNMSSIPKVKKEPLFVGSPASIFDIYEALFQCTEQRGLSDAAKLKIGEMIDNEYQFRIANLVVKKQLKCGVSAKLVNKAVPGTVFIMPYMRCRDIKHLHRIEYPAFLDVKADGMFLNLDVDGNDIKFLTRPGHHFQLDSLPMYKEIIDKTFGLDHVVFMGEARIRRDGKFLSRKEGNGLLNQILQGNMDADLHDEVVYSAWDIVLHEDFMAGEYNMWYQDRRQDLVDIGLREGEGRFELAHSEVVTSEEQAFEITAKWIENGEEGGVLKNHKGIWKETTSGSPDCIKLKSEKVCELRITGWNYAEADSKYDGLMGSVTAESEDGLLIVNISGWLDEERTWDWDEHIGKIISVKFNEVIGRKTDDLKSLFLPRVDKDDRTEFVEFRLDKTEADTLDDILKKKK